MVMVIPETTIEPPVLKLESVADTLLELVRALGEELQHTCQCARR
jgi:hypothetical protein